MAGKTSFFKGAVIFMLLLFACAFFGFVSEAKAADDIDKLKELRVAANNQTVNLKPAFDPNILFYSLDLPSDFDQLNITATAADPVSQIMITVNGSPTTGSTITLGDGKNTIQLQVNSGRGTIKTYTIYVRRMSPSGLVYYDSSKAISDQQMKQGQKFCIPYSVILGGGSYLNSINVTGSPNWSVQYEPQCGQNAYSFFDPNATGVISIDFSVSEQRADKYCSYDRWGTCTVYWNTYYVTVHNTVTINVASVNNPPIVQTLQDVKMRGNDPPLDIPISVTDPDTARENLQVSVASSNAALFPIDRLIVNDIGQTWNLRMQPVPGQRGSSVITVTAFDGESSVSSAFTVTVDDAVNMRPIVTNAEKWISGETTLHFQEDDFVNQYTDVDGDPLQRIQITRLPEHGQLLLKGAPVTLLQEITRTELPQLAYIPVDGWNGIDSLSWSGYDGKEYSDKAAVYTLGTDIAKLKELRFTSYNQTVNLNQAFDPNVLSYTLEDLPSYFDQLDIMATALDSESQITISVNGSPITGTSIALADGKNTIQLQLNAGRGTIQTYTIYVRRMSPSSLVYYDSSKAMSDQHMQQQQEFCIPNSDILGTSGSYITGVNVIGSPTWSVRSADQRCGVAFSFFDPNATGAISLVFSVAEQRLQKSCVRSGFDYKCTYNTYYVDVQKTVTINIASVNDPSSSLLSNNADLTDLKVNGTTVTGFESNNTGPYSVSIPNSLTWADITYSKSDSHASVAVTGDVYLPVGENTVTVTVTAEDRTKKVYTVNVTRTEASSNADLRNLTLSNGELSPSFEPGATAYTAAVPFSVSSLTVTASVYDSDATMTVNGVAAASGQPSVAINLSVGSNPVDIVVAAQNGTTKVYQVIVSRDQSATSGGSAPSMPLSGNSDLSSLMLSSGELSPAFATGITAYAASVPYPVSMLTVTAGVYDSKATVMVNGSVIASGQPSSIVNLKVGTNLIDILVTAQNGMTKAYKVTVTRGLSPTTDGSTPSMLPSGNADLNSLTLSSGELSPAFAPGSIVYTATVPNSVSSLTVTANVYDSNATLAVNGNAAANGQASSVVYLNVGTNPINIVVTAQNGTTKTYRVTVTRGQSATSRGDTPSSSPSGNIVTATDGKLTLPSGETGNVSLGNAVRVVIPKGATDKELKLSIEKVTDTQNLFTHNEVPVSPIFEILKNFSENFSKPVTLTFVFDLNTLKNNQRAAVFYYDEINKGWVEVVDGVENGNHITVKVNHFTKFAVFAVDKADDISTKGSSPGMEKSINFSDMNGHWAEASIMQAIRSGIVSGYPDGTFKPDASVTRAEFAVMLMNALKPQGDGASLTFTDKAKIGAWAQKSVEQAVYAGIITGYEDSTFRPDAEITRPEMAAMIAKALGQSIEEKAVTGFADDRDIPDWAKGAVAAMKKRGVIEGKGANAFAPGDKTTRAEAVTVLQKMLAQKSK
ncbi:cadherin-like beta sandwich domain-containing protein [Gordoniibacillus kamchatkensis]|uniref:cadherin-like beta sandwich domain-containing protein n=1 Tax=Gordoniibacillus kamchatkensis TaxID=1590651 RepID=UPI000695F35E|nr:cadherin-like beta sandwich domain-containing protein [Paenibacillus sp. VKM B-2647]